MSSVLEHFLPSQLQQSSEGLELNIVSFSTLLILHCLPVLSSAAGGQTCGCPPASWSWCRSLPGGSWPSCPPPGPARPGSGRDTGPCSQLSARAGRLQHLAELAMSLGPCSSLVSVYCCRVAELVLRIRWVSSLWSWGRGLLQRGGS